MLRVARSSSHVLMSAGPSLLYTTTTTNNNNNNENTDNNNAAYTNTTNTTDANVNLNMKINIVTTTTTTIIIRGHDCVDLAGLPTSFDLVLPDAACALPRSSLRFCSALKVS